MGWRNNNRNDDSTSNDYTSGEDYPGIGYVGGDVGVYIANVSGPIVTGDGDMNITITDSSDSGRVVRGEGVSYIVSGEVHNTFGRKRR